MGRRVFSFFLFACVVNLAWFAPAGAQERKGTITGHVTDTNRAVLQGARIELQPKGPTAVSDGQGQFTVSGVTPGHYTVSISYAVFCLKKKKTVVVGRVLILRGAILHYM